MNYYILLNTHSVHPNISQTYHYWVMVKHELKLESKKKSPCVLHRFGPTLSTSLVHIFSYSTVTLVDIVRLPFIRTLKIISRV